MAGRFYRAVGLPCVSFVPLAQAQRRGEDVVVPFGKDMVKDAPHAEPDGFLSLVEETQLFRH